MGSTYMQEGNQVRDSERHADIGLFVTQVAISAPLQPSDRITCSYLSSTIHGHYDRKVMVRRRSHRAGTTGPGGAGREPKRRPARRRQVTLPGGRLMLPMSACNMSRPARATSPGWGACCP